MRPRTMDASAADEREASEVEPDNTPPWARAALGDLAAEPGDEGADEATDALAPGEERSDEDTDIWDAHGPVVGLTELGGLPAVWIEPPAADPPAGEDSSLLGSAAPAQPEGPDGPPGAAEGDDEPPWLARLKAELVATVQTTVSAALREAGSLASLRATSDTGTAPEWAEALADRLNGEVERLIEVQRRTSELVAAAGVVPGDADRQQWAETALAELRAVRAEASESINAVATIVETALDTLRSSTEASDATVSGDLARRLDEIGTAVRATPAWTGDLLSTLDGLASGLEAASAALDPARLETLAGEVAEMREQVAETLRRSSEITEAAMGGAREVVDAAVKTVREALAGGQLDAVLAAVDDTNEGLRRTEQASGQQAALIEAVRVELAEMRADEGVAVNRERIGALLTTARAIQADIAALRSETASAEALGNLANTADALYAEIISMSTALDEAITRNSDITSAGLETTRQALDTAFASMGSMVDGGVAAIRQELTPIKVGTDPEATDLLRRNVAWLVEAVGAEVARSGEVPQWASHILGELATVAQTAAANTDQIIQSVNGLDRHYAPLVGIGPGLDTLNRAFEELAAQVAGQHADTRERLDGLADGVTRNIDSLRSIEPSALAALFHSIVAGLIEPIASGQAATAGQIEGVLSLTEGFITVLEQNSEVLTKIEEASTGPDDLRIHLAEIRTAIGGLAREMNVVNHAVGIGEDTDQRPLVEALEDTADLTRQALGEIIESRTEIAASSAAIARLLQDPHAGGAAAAPDPRIDEILARLSAATATAAVGANVIAVEQALDSLAADGTRPDAVFYGRMVSTARDVAALRLIVAAQGEDLRALVQMTTDLHQTVDQLSVAVAAIAKSAAPAASRGATVKPPSAGKPAAAKKAPSPRAAAGAGTAAKKAAPAKAASRSSRTTAR